MRHPTSRSSNLSGSGTITPSPSLRARRVSSTPSSLENPKVEADFVKYYQYKTQKADPVSLLNIVIAEDLNGFKDSKYAHAAFLWRRSEARFALFVLCALQRRQAARHRLFVDCVLAALSDVCRVLMVGIPGTGKSSLVAQFSSHLEAQNAATAQRGQSENEHNARNGREASLVLHFRKITSLDECLPRSPITMYQPDAYVVVYAVNDR